MEPTTLILLGGGAAIAWLLSQKGAKGGSGSGSSQNDEVLGAVEDSLQWVNNAVGNVREWVENDLQNAFGLPGEHTLKNFSGICHAAMMSRLSEPESVILNLKNDYPNCKNITVDEYRPNLFVFLYHLMKSNIVPPDRLALGKYVQMMKPLGNSNPDDYCFGWTKAFNADKIKDYMEKIGMHGENKYVVKNLAVVTDTMRKQYNVNAGMSPIQAFNTYPDYNAVYDYATNNFGTMEVAPLANDFVMHTGNSPNYYTDNPDRALDDFNALEYFTSCPIRHKPNDGEFFLHTLIPRHTYAYFRIARIMHGKVAYTVDKNFRELSLSEKKNVMAHLWFANKQVVTRGFRQAIIAKGKPWKKD